MARFREYCYEQTMMLPVALSRQIAPGTFEHAINHLVDHHIDRSVFEACYRSCMRRERGLYGPIGRRGKPVKSNITDNESAKIFDSAVLATDEFVLDAEATLICPAGKPMKSSCPLREQCLRSPNSPVRQVTKTDWGNGTIAKAQYGA